MMLRECGVKDQVTIYTGPSEYPLRGKPKTGVGIKSK